MTGGITYNGLRPDYDFVVERAATYVDQARACMHADASHTLSCMWNRSQGDSTLL